MKTLTFIIVATFLTLSLFSFYAMGHAGGHEDGCIATAIQSTDCPAIENYLSYLSFHSKAFKTFSDATVNFGSAVSLLLLFSFLIFAWLKIFRKESFVPIRVHVREIEESTSFSKKKFSRWFSFHENSPNN